MLFYTTTTVFHLYQGGDMMHEMRKQKPAPTPLLTQGIFKLLHDMAMVWEELAFDDAVSYTHRGTGLYYS